MARAQRQNTDADDGRAATVVSAGSLYVGRDFVISLAAATATSSFRGKIEAFFDEYLVSETGPVPFGGRDSDLHRLDSWLTDESEPGRLLLTAPAGRGKSALLVHWIGSLQARGLIQNEDGDGWHVIFVPISIRFGSNRPSVFYQALAKRLAEIVGKKLQAASGDSDAYYADQAQTFLRHLVTSGKSRVLVIVDGLDEALGHRFAAEIFPRAPGLRLKIIVSARLEAGDVDAGGWLQRLGWDRGVRVDPFELGPLDTDGVEDVLMKMGAPLNELGAQSSLVEKLWELTEGGEPLLLRFYVEDLWKEGDAVAGLRVDDLEKLNPGFGAYFERWLILQRQVWKEEGLAIDEATVEAILAVLACAYGPMEREALSGLAHDVHGAARALSTQRLLDPLRRFVIGDGSAESGYVLSHPKIGHYLREEHLDSGAVRNTLKGFADWGRATVAALNVGSLPPEHAPAYLLQFYAQHLEDVDGCIEEFMALVEDGWRRAWETYEGSFRGFATDVRVAWRVAQRAKSSAARELGAEIRCALCISSLCSLGTNTPPDLLTLAVSHSALSVVQALHLAEVRQGSNRLQALVALIPHLQKENLEELLSDIRSLDDARSRAQYLLALLDNLPDKREPLLRESIASAKSVADPSSRATLLTNAGLLLHSSDKNAIISDALDAIWNINDGYSRSVALANLAAIIDDERQDFCLFRSIDDMMMVADSRRRALGLIALAERLPETHRAATYGMALGSAVAALVESRSGGHLASSVALHFACDAQDACALAWAGLAQQLPPLQRDRALAHALQIARTIPLDLDRADALGKLVPKLEGRQRVEIVQEAYSIALKLPTGKNRTYALTGLIPLLPDAQRGEAIAAALHSGRLVEDEYGRFLAIIRLARELRDESNRMDVFSVALASTYSIPYIDHRAHALVKILPDLPMMQREAVVDQLIEFLEMPLEVGLKADILADLAPYVPEHRQNVVTSMIIDAANALLRITFGFGMFSINRLLPLVPENERGALLIKSLAKSAKERDPYFRFARLVDFMPFLSGETEAGLFSQIVDSARAVPNEEARGRAVAGAAKCASSESDAQNLVREALDIAQTLADDYKRTILLVDIASNLPHAPESREALRQARDSAIELAQDDPRGVSILTQLAAHLPEHQAELTSRAFELAAAIPDLDARGQAFAGLVKNLSGAERLTALRCILERCSRIPRANSLNVLGALAPILAQEGGDDLVLSAIEGIQRVAKWWP